MTRFPVLLQTVLGVLLLTHHATAADWPHWMGPKRDGVSTAKDWSADWPEDGLLQLWTTQIGIGFSSVSIVDGLLYAMGHADGKETVWCLNADTGAEVWSHSYAAELNANLYEGGPGATPTVDSDYVYTLSIDGRLLCLARKTGDVMWQNNLQKDLDVDLHEWGFDSSPLVLDEQLILQGGRLVSYNKRSGKLNWRSEKHTAGYGAVRAFAVGDEALLAHLDCDGLRINNSTDGSEVAFTPWKSPFRTNSTTPIVVDDQIYISSGYNVGCGLFRLQGNQLKEVYANKQMRNHFNNSILLDGYLYGFDGNSNLGRVVTLTCMKLETGEVMWKQQGLGCGSLMIADNKLLIQSEGGELVLAKAQANEYQELARSKFLTNRCWTVPLLLNGRIYGRNAKGTLKCVQLPKRE